MSDQGLSRGFSSRLVSSMSAAEVEKKRALDRINQRYSRARKRSKIEELQQQNQTLVTRLAEAKKEIARLRQNEDSLRRAFETAYAILNLSESRSGTSSEELEDPSASNATTPNHTLRDQSIETSATVDVRPTPQSPSVPVNAVSEYAASSNGSAIIQPGSSSTSAVGNQSEFEGGVTVNLLSEPLSNHILTTSGESLDPVTGAFSLWDDSFDPMCFSWHFSDVFPSNEDEIWHDSAQTTGQIGGGTHSSTTETHQPGLLFSESPIWQLLPLHTPPTTQLDNVLLSVAESGRQWKLQRGQHHSEITQPTFPSISSLLNPESTDHTAHPISTAVGKHAWRTSVQSFPARIAFHYVVAHLVRWLVSPTERNYNQLPDFIKPTELQRSTPHPAWIDTFGWPEARDLIIKNMDYGEFDELRRLTSITFSVNWPYAESDAFLTSADGKQLVLNPVFESHIRDIKNWTIGPNVAQKFPFLSWCPTRVQR